MKKILSILIAIFLLFGMTGCDKSTSATAPDYSDSDKKITYFAYNPLSDGRYVENDKEIFVGENFLTEKYMQEYFDAGLDKMQVGHFALIQGEDSEGWARAKKILDMAHALGHDNSIILTDYRILVLFERANGVWDSIIGENSGQFASMQAMEEAFTEYLKLYQDHPAFGGIALQDEPRTWQLNVYGEIYRTLKKVAPDLNILANLLPYSPQTLDWFPEVEEDFSSDEQLRNNERYRRYLKTFMDNTGAKVLQYDYYPLYETGVLKNYVLNFQIAAEVAKEYGAEFKFVSQTFTMNNSRIMSNEDLRWLNNMNLGFGAKSIGYYTYFVKDSNDTESIPDNSSYINRFGEKTQIYYDMQKIHGENDTFEHIITNFDYVTSSTYTVANCGYSSEHSLLGLQGTFQKLKDFEINKEMALVTELYDDEKGNYMYMAQNIIDPQYLGSNAYQTATLTFDTGYTMAYVYSAGNHYKVKLANGNKLTVKMNPGDAYFVIPY